MNANDGNDLTASYATTEGWSGWMCMRTRGLMSLRLNNADARKTTRKQRLSERRGGIDGVCLWGCAVVVIFVLPFASCVAHAADGPAAFRFSKDVQRTAGRDEEIIAVTLDSEIYAATRDGLPDLRITDLQDAEVSYVIRKATETRVKIIRQSVRSNVVSLHETQANQIEVIHVFTHREPLTSFTLMTDSRNFSRQAVVEIPVSQGVQTRWQLVGHATVSVINFGDLNREELTITFPEQRQEEYRITIRNQDNAPLNITGVKAEGNVYRAVFLAAKDTQYRLYYGSETSEMPNYDTAAVMASLHEGYQPVEATLKAQVANSAFDEASKFAFGKMLENKLVLGAMIAVTVIVLSWILFRASQQVGEIPLESDSSEDD